MTIENSRGHWWLQLPRRPRNLAGIGLAIIAGCGSACGGPPSTHVAVSNQSAAASLSPACALMTTSQASSILGQAAWAVPTKPDSLNDSSCMWHPSGSRGIPWSFSIYLYRNTSAVQSFRSNLAHPRPSVLTIKIDGQAALWRPYSGPGDAFVSTATNHSLLAVEAAGGTSAIDGVAKAAIKSALDSLRLHER
jgi:hypothetical protein